MAAVGGSGGGKVRQRRHKVQGAVGEFADPGGRRILQLVLYKDLTKSTVFYRFGSSVRTLQRENQGLCKDSTKQKGW